MPNGSALWERAVVCRPTHPKTAHLQLSRSQGLLFFYKASHESALTPFLGISTRCVDQAQSCSRRKRGRVREGLRDRPGTEKGSEAWLARRGSSQEEHTVNSLGWAERHGNRAGVADSLAWREGGEVGCRARVRTRHKARRAKAREGERPETGHKLVRGQLGFAQGGKMTRTGQRPGPGPEPGPGRKTSQAPPRPRTRTPSPSQGSQRIKTRTRATATEPGPQGHRATGPQGHSATGPQGHRATGSQGHRATGPQRVTGPRSQGHRHRATGPQGHRATGPQGHRATRPSQAQVRARASHQGQGQRARASARARVRARATAPGPGPKPKGYQGQTQGQSQGQGQHQKRPKRHFGQSPACPQQNGPWSPQPRGRG